MLGKPLLYLSAYFERRRQAYYERLLQVSLKGQWTEWFMFFLRGIIEQSKDAFEKARQLTDLLQQYHELVHMTKKSSMQIRLVDLLIERPVVTTVFVAQRLNVTYPTAKDNIAKLVKAGILRETTNTKRNRIYIAEKVLEIINRPFSAR